VRVFQVRVRPAGKEQRRRLTGNCRKVKRRIARSVLGVHIRAVFQKQFDEVDPPCPGRFVERRGAGGVLDVHIHPLFEYEPRVTFVALGDRVVKRRGAVGAAEVIVRTQRRRGEAGEERVVRLPPGEDEALGGLGVVAGAGVFKGEVEGGFSLVVLPVHLGAGLQHRVHGVRFPGFRGEVENRPALRIRACHGFRREEGSQRLAAFFDCPFRAALAQ